MTIDRVFTPASHINSVQCLHISRQLSLTGVQGGGGGGGAKLSRNRREGRHIFTIKDLFSLTSYHLFSCTNTAIKLRERLQDNS